MRLPHLPSVVFLDRDGVLIENVPTYIREWGEVQLFEQAAQACSILSKRGIPLIVVTNQSGIGRGILTHETAERLNRQILAEIEFIGAKFLDSYMCPHSPDDGCDCRKPRPGMLVRASRDHNLDLPRAIFVGDSATDLEAAEAAGVTGVLVRTGRGREQEQVLVSQGKKPIVFRDLLAVVAAMAPQP